MDPVLGRSNWTLPAGPLCDMHHDDEIFPDPPGDQHEAAATTFTGLSTQEAAVIGSTRYPYASHDEVSGTNGLLLFQHDSTMFLDAPLDPLSNGVYLSPSRQEGGITGSTPYPHASFCYVFPEMSHSYQVDTFGQISTTTWVGSSNMEQTNDTKYRYDAYSWPYTFTAIPNAMNNQPNARAARQRSVTPPKKLFFCTSVSCQRTFTTRYRLNTHVNRFHTAAGQQKCHQCEHCSYTTFYRTDLPRHRKNVHAANINQ
ncbi:hypothetical protein HYPSUDRAFT_73058 [Hypholoma sublateritium FD-334 SS-4]|uniref:C2H2-type domain-containing protein n=1 Tax=Hypholoma sublateritium (strain FD-334 SS-4) TaxID=945553 RepID=A0A0D2KFX8_HYPSF|nr:hypothetical protein HYPSUDRAFT_73058 [Hypholoma sublateritium FD-334 SS-4]